MTGPTFMYIMYPLNCVNMWNKVADESSKERAKDQSRSPDIDNYYKHSLDRRREREIVGSAAFYINLLSINKLLTFRG